MAEAGATARDFEKVGVFYLGRVHDPATEVTGEEPLLYDSRDLVTHAVCVGMTGSGKTGLCIDLLEEAALDGVPAVAIDPKGDLGNLLLTFPELRTEDFRPWVDESEAQRKGLSPEAHAEAQARLWREGLAAWGQDGERIRRLKASADFTIYTPGSTAGRPLSILRTLAAPGEDLRTDAELLGDRVDTTVTGLLGLLGVEADPLQSREHILLSTVLSDAWRAGRDLNLPGLIHAIQEPPVKKVGVMDVEAFYPSKDRYGLALRINNLLASPGFATWLAGDPVDAGRLLYTADGKPRVSIVSIAHLSDTERMFVVALLLNEVLGWTRSQPGTASLRAIIYMDEIFGFFPPVAEPPSKRPLLTLLKQARAHGVGIVLATQNPVDLDYKGLANTGTWLLGRLQTERDKERVLEGLEGVAAGTGEGFDRARMGELLAGLGKRIFLMHNVHESEAVVFETRWAMSYLRGPLTRAEIRRLTLEARGAAGPDGAEVTVAAPMPETVTGAPSARSSEVAKPVASARPIVPPGIEELFVPAPGEPAGQPLHYEPALLALVDYVLDDRALEERVERAIVVAAPLATGAVPVSWKTARELGVERSALAAEPVDGATFGVLPTAALETGRYRTWKSEVADWVVRTQELAIRKSPSLGELSKPGEDERAFRIRLGLLARARRDEARQELEAKYGERAARLSERIRKAEQAVQREAEQARHAKLQTAVSLGAALLGALFGRRTLGRATTTARGVGRTLDQAGDVGRAEEDAARLREELAQLDAELQAEIATLEERIAPADEVLEEMTVRPEKRDVAVRLTALGWLPRRVGPDRLPATSVQAGEPGPG